MKKNLKTWLGAVCMAAVAAAMIPAAPAEAGMGTGNPPPPPPPPVKKKFRLFEGSTDTSIAGNGYPGITVYHTPSWVTNKDACTTTDNGWFEYIVRSDQPGVEHKSKMFGISCGPVSNQDLVVATDAVLKIVVADDEPAFNDLAVGSGALVTKWKMDFEYQRGHASGPQQYSSNPQPLQGRSFGIKRIPRHLDANPLSPRSSVKNAVFQLRLLEGYDASGTMRLKWMDSPANGRKAVFPGYNSDQGGPDAALVLHKILATTEK